MDRSFYARGGRKFSHSRHCCLQPGTATADRADFYEPSEPSEKPDSHYTFLVDNRRIIVLLVVVFLKEFKGIERKMGERLMRL